MSLLRVESLCCSYEDKKDVLSQISFQAEAGERIGLVGANGAGKSTLLKALVGLVPVREGRICVDGILLERSTLADVRDRIGYVFQDSDSQLFMATVEEDVAFGPRSSGLSEEQVQQRTERALEMTGMEQLRHKSEYRLSGGEKKLASIATVLSMTPQMLLMDEPSAALDPGNRRRLIRIINSLEGAMIIASHDLDFILDTCSRVLLLDHGTIIRDDQARTILSDRNLMEEHGLELPLMLQGVSQVRYENQT